MEKFRIVANIDTTSGTSLKLLTAAMEAAGFPRGTAESEGEFLNRIAEEWLCQHLTAYHADTVARNAVKTASQEVKDSVTITTRNDIPEKDNTRGRPLRKQELEDAEPGIETPAKPETRVLTPNELLRKQAHEARVKS